MMNEYFKYIFINEINTSIISIYVIGFIGLLLTILFAVKLVILGLGPWLKSSRLLSAVIDLGRKGEQRASSNLLSTIRQEGQRWARASTEHNRREEAEEVRAWENGRREEWERHENDAQKAEWMLRRREGGRKRNICTYVYV